MLTPQNGYDGFFACVVVAWTVVFMSIIVLFVKALSVLIVGVFFWDERIQQQRQNARGTVASGVDLMG
eukprot:1054696-Rhodomonas_salina.1